MNSGIVAISAVAGALVINTMSAYAFARLRFPGRNVLFLIFLGTLMIPFQIVMVPAFTIVKTFGWLDTYKALIIPWLPNAFSIFFLRQFFRTIPAELEEAAIIDGASRIQVFYKIILPLSIPAIATISLLTFMWFWDGFLWPLIVTRSQDMYVVQLGIATFFGQYLNEWNMIMAGATIAALPTYILFISLQKYYIEGVALTGLKG